MSLLASALTGIRGERVALTDVSVSATLRDLLAEVTVIQTYRNDEQVNIEAVYTFPLPLDAVLLDLQVELGGRVLKGVSSRRRPQREKYEDAVDSGDAAVMLEVIEPGLYTMNVGNLLPGRKRPSRSVTRCCIAGRATGCGFLFRRPWLRVSGNRLIFRTRCPNNRLPWKTSSRCS